MQMHAIAFSFCKSVCKKRHLREASKEAVFFRVSPGMPGIARETAEETSFCGPEAPQFTLLMKVKKSRVQK